MKQPRFLKRRIMRRAAHGSRRLSLENLESRYAMHGDAVGPSQDLDLTISFVPDGTNVADRPSEMFAEFEKLAPAEDWQASIVAAFKAWSQWIGAKVTVVEDQGEELGAEGESDNDPRFGDIRVAALPMLSDVVAIAVPQSAPVGTWAGDILFNSDAPIDSPRDLFAVALHEAGHVLGLQHSDNPNSPMYAHGIPEMPVPTLKDIQQLRELYGLSGHHSDPSGSGEQSHNHHANPQRHDLDEEDRPEGEGPSVGITPVEAVDYVFNDLARHEEEVSPPEVQRILEESLSSQNDLVMRSFTVSQPELVRLVLNTSSQAHVENATVSATILNPDGRIVRRLEANVGTAATADAVLLWPGEYHVLLTAATSDGQPLLDTSIELSQISESGNLGPGVSDPTSDPMYPKTTYSYPTSSMTTDPYSKPNPSYAMWTQWWWYYNGSRVQ